MPTSLLSTTRWLRLLVFLRRRSVTVAAPYLDRVSYLSLPFGHGRHDPRARGHFFNAVPLGVFHVIKEITRAPRFLDNPCLHAPLCDPGGSIGCSDAEGCRENRVAMPLQLGPNRITLCFPRDPTARRGGS